MLHVRAIFYISTRALARGGDIFVEHGGPNGPNNQAPGEIPVGLFSAPRFDTWITSKYPLATYLAWVDFLKSGHLRAIRDSVLRANGIFCFWI